MKLTNLLSFSHREAWRSWLEANHDKFDEIWLTYYKPNSHQTGVDYEASVEEALCFGWIDSIIQKIDEEKYARKFNPRRPGSAWSESNKRRVVRLARAGRMTPAGMAVVTFDLHAVDLEAPMPKRPPMEMTEKIKAALRSELGVWEAFQRISPSHRRAYILWLSDAKKPETFQRRLRILKEEVLAGKPSVMH
jgi:uncharacterized protein YdeI (YjbR/CyaY-like superfamily)